MQPPADTVQKIGRYDIVRKIATGGMAELFLGKFKGPGGFEKRCALKRILPQFAADQTFQRMFQNEARVSAMFDHPNVVQVFELGKDEQGQFFIAMELVNGMNLRQLVQLAQQTGQRIPPELAAFMMAQALDGLAYAHGFRDPETGEALNLVHRDISPQNILVSYEGAVKLVDFGIVKGSSISGETQAGMLKGKVAYMSPEQASGEPLDGRSDLFSIGVCFFELITGQRPFQGTNDIMTLKAILDDPPIPVTRFLPEVAEGIEHTIYRALEKFPVHRYGSARDFHLELQHVLRDCPTPLGRHVVADYIRALTEGATVSFDASRLHIPRGLHGGTPAGFATGTGRSVSGSGSHPGLPAQSPGVHSSHPGYAANTPQPWTQPPAAGPIATSAAVDYSSPPVSTSSPEQRTPLPLDESIGGTSEMLRQAGLPAPKRGGNLWLLFALSTLLGAAAVGFFLHQQQQQGVVLVEPASQNSGRVVDLQDEPGGTEAPPPAEPAPPALPTNPEKAAITKVPAAESAKRKPPAARSTRRRSKTRARRAKAPPVAAAKGELSVTSIPSGLTVLHGSKRLGRTPLKTKLPPGDYALTLRSATRGIRRDLKVTVTKDGITSEKVQFSRGTLKVVSRPWAEVFVNGTAKGKTPLTVTLFEGRQTIKLVTEDGQERVQVEQIEADKETLVRVKF